jgi:hypothetical protein
VRLCDKRTDKGGPRAAYLERSEAIREVGNRNTITNLETNRSSGDEQTLAKLRDTMQSAGVIFITSNGDGPGVRVRKLAEGDRVQFILKATYSRSFLSSRLMRSGKSWSSRPNR